jgi:hypothetical protein
MCLNVPPKRLDPEKDQRRAAEHADVPEDWLINPYRLPFNFRASLSGMRGMPEEGCSIVTRVGTP